MKRIIMLLGLVCSMFLTGCVSATSKPENSSDLKPSDKTFMMLKNKTEDGETVSDLYVKYYGSDEQKVTQLPDPYPNMKYISGNNSMLVLDEDGNLYEYKKDGDKNKIGSDVFAEGTDAFDSYDVSKENNTIVYLTNDYSLYAVYQGKDKIKVASDVDFYEVSDDGKYIYYLDSEGSLYSFDSSEEKEKIESNVTGFKTYDNGNGVIFNTNYQELYKKTVNEKEAQKIDDGFISFENIIVEDNNIIYLSEYDYDLEKGELFVNNKKGKTKIASDVIDFIKVKDDFYYINSENNFYKKNIKDDKSERISSDVIEIYNANGTIYYIKNNNELYKLDSKESKKVGVGIEDPYYVNVVNGKDILFKNKDGEIFLNEEKVISEVKDYVIDRDTLAYVNEKNEVHIFDLKNKKDEVVLKNAKSYSSIYYCGKFLYENRLTIEDLQGAWKYDDNYGGYTIYNFKGNNKLEVYTEAGLERTYTFKASSNGLDSLELETDLENIIIDRLDDKSIKLSIDSSEFNLLKVDNSLIENIKNNKPNNEDVDTSEEYLGENIDIKEDIAEFIKEYEYAYIDAVNSGSTYSLEDYLVYNGKLYNEHMENIPSYYEKGISETLYSVDITKIEKVNDREYRVTVNEKIGIIKEGNEEIKEFNPTYVVINDDGYLGIREIL